MTTFGAWLGEQSQRADIVGELARKWDEIKGTDKIRALPSIQKRLAEHGLFTDGSPWVGAWTQVIEEWRNRSKPPEAPDGEAGAAMAEARETLRRPLVSQSQLDRIEAKLDWFHEVVTIASEPDDAAALPPWPDTPPAAGELGPIDWASIHGLADFDAPEEGEAA